MTCKKCAKLLAQNKELLKEVARLKEDNSQLSKKYLEEKLRPKLPRGYTHDASGVHPPGVYGI